MAFANTMESNLAAARRAMQSDKAYRGTGVSTPRRAPIYGGNQGKGGQGNFRRVPRQPGIAAANVRPRGGGIFDAIRSKGKKFVHPAMEMLGRAGDTVKGAMMGSRLHKSYMNDLGRVAGHKAWENDKRMMMTDDEKAFEKKYLNLAAMAQDSETRDQHLATAETAWRNKQTSDRLAAVKGFEDYDKSPDADKYFVEQGDSVPGRSRLNQILQQFAPQEEGSIVSPHLDPDMDITADLPSAISYADPDLVNDDILYGEPGNMGNRIKPRLKPPLPETISAGPGGFEPVDPYKGIYESPLTDMTYGEELVDTTPQLPFHTKHRYLPRDTYGIQQMGGGMDPLPLISLEFDPDNETGYFDEEEKINPPWNNNKSPGRWGKKYNQYR